jgi:hypothetical protein
MMLGLLLRGGRPEVYAQQRMEPPRIAITQHVLSIEEALKEAENLGLPPPTIEAEYEEVEQGK